MKYFITENPFYACLISAIIMGVATELALNGIAAAFLLITIAFAIKAIYNAIMKDA